ncbi:hypothetical protein GCM10028895_17990 [Pontibacter rugosus]
MNRFLFTLLLFVSGLGVGTVQAQEVYGNEWIDYSKTYFKLKVTADGLYKLDYTYLKNLGLENENPQHLQLFRRGKEVAIYVAGEADGSLDAQDFLEFYGEKNNGVLDQELFKNPLHQVHQLHSMYTDTAAYFLTLNPAGGNKRMRELNPAVDGRTPEPYHLQKAMNLQVGTLYLGQPYGVNRMPWMDRGEGYFSSESNTITKLVFAIPSVSNIEMSGPAPVLEYAAVGPNEHHHNVDINLVNGNAIRTINNHKFGSFDFVKGREEITFPDINTSKSTLTVHLIPKEIDGLIGRVSLAYARLTFPQKNIFSGISAFLYTDSLRAAIQYFEYTGAPAAVVAYNVTDLGNVVRTQGVVLSGSSRKGFALQAGPVSQKYLLARTDQALAPVGKTEIIKFQNIVPADYNYIIVTNKKLMKKVGDSQSPAPMEYAAYRGSAAGGGYNTLVVFVDDLVNMFHYGEFSANALKRFSSYLATSDRGKFVLYMGKAYEVRMLSYKNAASRAKDLVPTGLGTHPASDLLFSTRFKDSNYVPMFPTGRLSVVSAEEVMAYLNKVKEYEQAKVGEPWRKNILHLGGGNTSSEINQIANHLSNYKKTAEGPFLGANVIQKTRHNLSEVVEVIDVSKEVNAGVSLLTFFGHSSTGTTDLDIGYASSPFSNYKNKGKYPIMFMNGCNAGNAFVSDNDSFGEDWLKTPDKGAVALIAHVDGGYIQYLNNYTSIFYNVAFKDPSFYGKSLGEVQKETITRLSKSALANNEIMIAMMLEMVLQGDPTLRIYNPEKPDYFIVENSLSITNMNGERASAIADTLLLTFEVGNLGKAIEKSIYISISRRLPDNTTQVLDSIKIDPIFSKRRVNVKIPNKGMAALGMNILEVKLDSPGAFDEINVNNNSAIYRKFLSASGLVAVNPQKYDIVGTQQVKLIVQATAEKENHQGIYFEMDTTSTFKSAWVKSKVVSNPYYAAWEVTLPDNSQNKNKVYYWRARFSTYEPGEDTLWVKSSFRHLPNVNSGWSQSHKGQFTEALTNNIEPLSQQDGVWQFSPISKPLELRTAGGAIRWTDPPYGFLVDGEHVIGHYCGGNSEYIKVTKPMFYMFAYDSKTLEPIKNKKGQTVCGYEGENFLFNSDDLSKSENVAKIKAFIDDIPEGQYVAAIGINNIPFDNLPEEAKAAFRSIGSVLIDDLKTGDPFAIVGIKGAAPGTAQEKTYDKEDSTPAASQSIGLSVTLQTPKTSGTITSSLIGPVLEWGTLHHNIVNYQESKGEIKGNDNYKLSVIGVDSTGTEVVLVEDVKEGSKDISDIDAALYPNLKLSAFLSDDSLRTAPQLKEWYVTYNGAPEGMVRPDLVKASTDDLTPLAGSGSLTVPMAFQNITSTAFSDSLTVEVTLSGDGIQASTSSFKIKPVGANEIVKFDYTFSTKQFEGTYKVEIDVNPRILPEQDYTNNFYEVEFNVKSKLHPIMNVAFDGIQIMDGDIVSPSPLISVVVKDENDYVFLKDPSQMSLVLIDPVGVPKEIDLMSNPQEISFIPATEKSDFKLEYKPTRLLDGKYKMEVRAKDAVGKDSGVSPYRIGFEVIGEASVTNFYPFPNPFSSKTNFIFTLTGSTIPEHMKIQILTVTGKVIKEIMKEELGPLRIGNNKTEYAWDGTDMYGDKLANGVYLYRVIMSKGEEEMKHRNTFGDKAFKNGYGKLYILR